MPPRSAKMNRFIFGFQRRVWWPKWTPASRSSRMETTAMGFLPLVDGQRAGGARTEPAGTAGTPVLTSAGEWDRSATSLAGTGRLEGHLELGRQRRFHLDGLAGERMREREPGGVQELAAEAEVALDAVDRVAGDRELDRRQVDANLMRPPGLEPDAEKRVLRQQLDHLEVRDRVARRVGVQRPAERVDPVATDRRLDPAAHPARPA